MEFKISFKKGAFGSRDEILNFALNHLHFIPLFLTSIKSFPNEYRPFEKEPALRELKKNEDNAFTIAENDYTIGEEKVSLFFREEDSKQVQYFIYKFEQLDKSWLKNLIKDAHQFGFFEAYIYDWSKSMWQNELFINHFTQLRKSYDHLELKFHWHPEISPIYNEEVINIFHNPGHEILTSGTWLMAAPEMWFSTQAWKYFNKEKIKSFDLALEISENQDSLVYIKLFDPYVEDYETKKILDLQSKFRKHSEMNNIEKKLNSYLNSEDNREVIVHSIVKDEKKNIQKKVEIIEIKTDTDRALNIYEKLKKKYSGYVFEDFVNLHDQHFLIKFEKAQNFGVMRFLIEIATRPFKIFRREINLYTNDKAEYTEIKDYQEYEQILNDARKMAKSNQRG